MASRLAALTNIELSKSSGTFRGLKFGLTVTLVINLVILAATLPFGLVAIEDSKDTHHGDQNFSKSNAKFIFTSYIGVNVLTVVFALLGLTRQQFKVLIIVTVLMSIQSVASCFFLAFTNAMVMVVAINFVTTLMIAMFTYMCRDRNLERDEESDPDAASN